MRTAPPLHIDAQDLFAQIGRTPLLRFRRITAQLPAEIQLYAKAEWQNPGWKCERPSRLCHHSPLAKRVAR